MSLADQIRDFARRNYIDPARERKDRSVSIRAGDLHQSMGLRSRQAAVCAALGARKFEEMCRIERIAFTGPAGGANAVLTFRLN